MNLEQLRKQAKELVRAARAGDAEALERIQAHAPARDRVRLADAQLALAREHGLPSWPALVAARGTRAQRIERFVGVSTEGRLEHARRILAADPSIAEDVWAALVLGDRAPADPNAPGGPRKWPPLLYVSHSCFLGDPERHDALVELARALLGQGADPNVSAPSPNWPGSTWTSLYGAAGRAHDPELTRLLLQAGANPDDGESLYHATEAESTECLRALLEHGAEPNGTNALAHALDADRLQHVRLLLEAGADANEGAYVAHAVRRGRDSDFVRLLVEHGADVDRPGGETWRGNVPLRTPYQHAVLRGRLETAETLVALGASTELDSADRAVAAIARGQRPDTPLPEQLDPDAQEVLILTALRKHVDVVVDAVGPDFAGVVGGSPPGTLLQHAAWVGDPEAVRRLLERGADTAADALRWAAHGSGNNPDPRADHVAVAEMLVAAGATIEASLLEEAGGPLYEWLAGRLDEAA